MQYYISKKISSGFDQAIQLVTDALKKEGFGVLTEINIKEKMKDYPKLFGITFSQGYFTIFFGITIE